jgi:hypothetical protein
MLKLGGRARWLPVFALALAISIESSALAAGSVHHAAVKVDARIRGDFGHRAVGMFKVPVPAPLDVSGRSKSAQVHLVGDATAACHPSVTLRVRTFASSQSASREASHIASVGRIHAIAAGSTSTGPWRLSETRSQSTAHRRWYGFIIATAAKHRFAMLQVSGTADGSCADADFLHGPVVASLKQLLRGARTKLAVRTA